MGQFQAVILAAGMGVRLSGVVKDVPKGLVTVDGQTLMARSVAQLRAVGVDEIILVTGHHADLYRDFSAGQNDITLVHNELFQSSGNMYSFFLTRDLLHKDILLLESDLIYERRALDTVIQSQYADVVLLSGPTDAGDEVYVSAKDNRITGISKDPKQVGHIVGEWVGISRLSPDLQRAMFLWAEERFRDSLYGDYESDCLAQVAQGYDVAFEKVDDLVWSEMDDVHHYQRLVHEIYPKLQKKDAGV